MSVFDSKDIRRLVEKLCDQLDGKTSRKDVLKYVRGAAEIVRSEYRHDCTRCRDTGYTYYDENEIEKGPGTFRCVFCDAHERIETARGHCLAAKPKLKTKGGEHDDLDSAG